MSIEFINWYRIYPAIIWGIYINWRVSVRPSSAGLRNVHFLICILVLDINSQHLGNICQLAGISVPPSGAGLGNMSGQECTFSYMYTCIGYKLPTFGEYMLVGGFLCALRAQGWVICLVRNVHFLLCIPDNFPPDKFPYGQLSPGQVPLVGKHLKRTSPPRTTSPRTSSPRTSSTSDQTYSLTLRPKGAQKPSN